MDTRGDFNRNWLFSLDELPNSQSPDLDDSTWRQLNVPHDWSLELGYDKENSHGCVAYSMGGTGWYRKHFISPESLESAAVYVYFDGVYNHTHVYLNGHKLGYHPYGYTPFYYRLNDYLNPSGEQNVLAVMVDRTRHIDSRWYTGSGIYRLVELLVYNDIHFDIWPTCITTPTDNDVKIETKIVNERASIQAVTVCIEIKDENGKVVANLAQAIHAKAGTNTYDFLLRIENPHVWDMGDPYLYTAEIHVYDEESCIGTNDTRFGIRQFVFDTEKGFLLNGKSRKLKGVCLHHDGGLVGAAVPIDVWRRRLEILIEGGCNAIRTAHNPPSEAFLDLCDEMGLFVKHEFFDEWDYPKDKRQNNHEQHDDYVSRGYADWFQAWAETDLKTAMLRDRNHPSVFMWSLGNEIELTYGRIMQAIEAGIKEVMGAMTASGNGDAPDLDLSSADFDFKAVDPVWTPELCKAIYEKIPEQEYAIDETGKKLAGWVREVDTTRPVTMNAAIPSITYETGLLHDLDVAGFSYRRNIYDYGKQHYPEIPMFGAENFTQWNEWQAILERENIPGVFLWTGVCYLGEAGSRWPLKSSINGLLDLAGFKKPVYHFFKALWTEQPYVHLATQPLEGIPVAYRDNSPHNPLGPYRLDENGNVLETFDGAWNKRTWGWHQVNDHYNYESDGQMIVAEVYTNCASVELFLDDVSLGVKHMKGFDDRILKWAFPYKAGTLTARAIGADGSDTKITAGEPTKVRITVDKNEIAANYDDVVHVVAQFYDADSNIVRHTEREVTFSIAGAGRMLGVDNGTPDSVQPFVSDTLLTSQGRALMIMQADGQPGQTTITAKAGDMVSNAVTVKIR